MSASEPQKTDILLKILIWSRLSSVLAIISSLAGAIFMFSLGTVDTVKVFFKFMTGNEVSQENLDSSVLVIVDLLETIDDFLVALALLYFAWGIYSLIILVKNDSRHLPAWLHVDSITSLKKTLLEILVVLLAIVFIKEILKYGTIQTLAWNILVIPASIIAIALSIRLILIEKN